MQFLGDVTAPLWKSQVYGVKLSQLKIQIVELLKISPVVFYFTLDMLYVQYVRSLYNVMIYY